MKKIFKSKVILCITIIITYLISILSTNKVLAASGTLNCPSEAVVGNQISISAQVTGEIWNVSIVVNGTTIVSDSKIDMVTGNSTKTITGTYTPTSAGTLTVSLIGDVTDSDGNTVASFGTKTINVTEPAPPPPPPEENTTGGGEQEPNPPEENQVTGGENNTNIPSENNPPVVEPPQESKSRDNHLSSISVDVGTLTPAFNRDRTDYTITFPEDYNYKNLHTFRINATAAHNKARVEGAGVVTVEEGENTFEIKCTAEDGTIRTYRIKVNKPAELKQSDLRLKGITINLIDEEGKFTEVEDFAEKFDPDKFEYTLNVDHNITDLDIKTDIENTDILVNIEGGKELTDGENIVTITLTSPTDENVKTTYQIKVNREDWTASTNTVNETIVKRTDSRKKRNLLPIITVVVVILSAALVALLIINNKHNDDDDYVNEGDEGEDESYLKNENLEKLERRFNQKEDTANEKEEKLENSAIKVSMKEENNITDSEILTDAVQKSNEPEFSREILIDTTKLNEKDIKREAEKERKKESRINKLDELMGKNENDIEEDIPRSSRNNEKEDKFDKEEFFKDINNKKGKHF